ncbi:MAG: tRNA lysidine(34) synthetase TilS [Rickettsiales bacterium]|jgi:tRNA(Ile)-lysidine synthase|nr:tRNA lysidine(34) synthetase TilS [Rickettsiales bacterium]
MDIERKFAAKMAELLPAAPGKIAVALSGGSDSMALALLSAKWAGNRAQLAAVTVDHRLRPESALEAEKVGAWMRRRGIAHEILAYTGEIPSSNIEMRAREYRYGMLVDYCGKNGIGFLLVAHNADEQAETFFLNLARGSGVFGLKGMEEVSPRGGVMVVRPLLGFPKSDLRSYLEERRQPWVEDPSNGDERYKRARIRKLASLLSGLGLSPRRLENTMANMKRAAGAIEFYAERLLASAVSGRDGKTVLDAAMFGQAPEEVALRALAELVRRESGNDYPPRLAPLLRLYSKISGGSLGRGATLGGFKFSGLGSGMVSMEPEPPRAKKTCGKK